MTIAPRIARGERSAQCSGPRRGADRSELPGLAAARGWSSARHGGASLAASRTAASPNGRAPGSRHSPDAAHGRRRTAGSRSAALARDVAARTRLARRGARRGVAAVVAASVRCPRPGWWGCPRRCSSPSTCSCMPAAARMHARCAGDVARCLCGSCCSRACWRSVAGRSWSQRAYELSLDSRVRRTDFVAQGEELALNPLLMLR